MSIKTAAKPAEKTSSKTAVAKKAPAPKKVDLLGEHIKQAFARKPKGTFLKVSEIAAAITKAYPTSDVRPSSQTISGRCRDDRMPEGITGKTGPRGAVKN